MCVFEEIGMMYYSMHLKVECFAKHVLRAAQSHANKTLTKHILKTKGRPKTGTFGSLTLLIHPTWQGDDLIDELASQTQALNERLETAEISIFSGSNGQ